MQLLQIPPAPHNSSAQLSPAHKAEPLQALSILRSLDDGFRLRRDTLVAPQSELPLSLPFHKLPGSENEEH